MSNSGILRAKIPSLPATVMHSEFRSNLKGELTMGIYIYIYIYIYIFIYLFIFILFHFIFLCPILESSSVPKSPSQVPTAMHAEFSSNLNGELISHVTYLPRMYLLSSNARVLPGETNLLVR
jgi:hypothetical protein